jgi:DNA-binding Xre family transcriptional regulator
MEKRREIHFVVSNLIKIMNDNKLSKVQFADKIGIPEAKWNKIANGRQEIKVSEISKIAETLRMREIDLYTYPEKYIKTGKEESNNEVLITMKLNNILKDKVLSFISQSADLEILNKQ